MIEILERARWAGWKQIFRPPKTVPLRLAVMIVSWASVLHWTVAAGGTTEALDWANPPTGLFYEDWQSVYLNGAKCGYGYLGFRRVDQVIKTDCRLLLRVTRAGAPLELESVHHCEETIDGQPLRFASRLVMAGVPLHIDGTVGAGQVRLVLRQNERRQELAFPWRNGACMDWGLQRAISQSSLAAGSHFRVEQYQPELRYDEPLPVTVTVRGRRPCAELGREAILLEIIVGDGSASTRLESWLEADGRTLLSSAEMAGLRFVLRSVKAEEALADWLSADIFAAALVPIAAAIPNGGQAVRFVVRWKSGTGPSLEWPETARQQLLAQYPDRTVLLVRSGEAAWKKSSGGTVSTVEPGSEYLAANAVIDSEDPRVAALAREWRQGLASGTGTETVNRWALARELRLATSRYITKKNLGVGFATAGEVARRPEGDCTEHAVLLAAVARACGLPSRVAAGLVYVPPGEGSVPLLGYHLWTQIWFDGDWWDFDAAMPNTEQEPFRLAMACSSLGRESVPGLGLALQNVIGQIAVEIQTVEKPLPDSPPTQPGR